MLALAQLLLAVYARKENLVEDCRHRVLRFLNLGSPKSVNHSAKTQEDPIKKLETIKNKFRKERIIIKKKLIILLP
jgi:hypothetical protein